MTKRILNNCPDCGHSRQCHPVRKGWTCLGAETLEQVLAGPSLCDCQKTAIELSPDLPSDFMTNPVYGKPWKHGKETL